MHKLNFGNIPHLYALNSNKYVLVFLEKVKSMKTCSRSTLLQDTHQPEEDNGDDSNDYDDDNDDIIDNNNNDDNNNDDVMFRLSQYQAAITPTAPEEL